MGMLEKNFLVKALCDAQKSSGPETSGKVQGLIDKPSMHQRESCI